MKSYYIIYLALTVCLIATCIEARGNRDSKKSAQNSVANSDDSSDRVGKLFSLFAIVNFKNDPCQSTSSIATGSTSYRNGTCFTSSECSSKGGSSKGGCASGFGVCCVFTLSSTTDTTVNYNDTYLQNPNYPSAYSSASTVSYTVNKVQSDVCWLRLDFETFNIQGPADTEELLGGVCADTFKVTVTSGQLIPELCGQLTGQHIYVDMGPGASDSAILAFAFTGTSTIRKWEIKTEQLPCGVNYAPPDGCLQWHTGLNGQITNFNYATSAGPHLKLLNYAACVRQELGYCCVEYSVCSSNVDDFSLHNKADASTPANAVSIVGTDCIKTTGTDSTADYIVIDGSGGTCGDIVHDKYCGQRLNPTVGSKLNVPICDCTGPFSVGFHTDAYADDNSDKTPNRGVCLNYRQLPC